MRSVAIASALLGLTGCAPLELAFAVVNYYTRPPYLYTALPPLSSAEKTMTCPQVDLAIDRTDTVRWLIRSYPLGSTYGRSYDGVLNAADGRVLELLRLKRTKNCPPRATAFGREMDDDALLAEVESVQAKLDDGSGSKKPLLIRRTQLLDGLRLVPASGLKP